jgi:hypothetical protein
MHSHLYALGQQVSYAEDGIAWPWKGGFEVIALLPASSEEPAYRIRNAEQAYERVVCEHELSEHIRTTRTSWTRSLN